MDERTSPASGSDPTALIARLPPRYSHVVRDKACIFPLAAALDASDDTWTYAALWQRVEETVALLHALGIIPGDRVSIVGENGFQLVTLLLAASECGAWGVPLNARMAAHEVDAMIKIAECRVSIFCDSDMARAHGVRQDAEAHATCIGRILVRGEACAPPDLVPAMPDRNTAVLVFTSGTTGEPKGVMVSHLALSMMGANMAELRDVRADDVFYNSAPVSHAIGLGTVLMTSFWAGASTWLAPRFDPVELTRLILNGRVTAINAVPALFARLLDYADEQGINLSSGRVRAIATAGAPLDLALKCRAKDAFGLAIDNSYGMTEFNPVARSRGGLRDVEVGRLQVGVEMRIVDADAREAPSGVEGEIWLRGPQAMLGYFRDPASSAAAMRPGGWYATGDLATIDDGGDLRIVGRIKDMIIRSGFNVYPAEVEAAIAQLPGVAMVAVIGHPVPGNEEVTAFVQPMPGCTLDPAILADALRDRLAPYKRPSRWRILRDLPVGPTGKVMKIRLKEAASE